MSFGDDAHNQITYAAMDALWRPSDGDGPEFPSVREVRALLDGAGVSPNRVVDSQPLLHRAIARGDADMVAMLLGDRPGGRQAQRRASAAAQRPFFTSVFAAQGRRQLSTYRNAEIKTLLTTCWARRRSVSSARKPPRSRDC